MNFCSIDNHLEHTQIFRSLTNKLRVKSFQQYVKQGFCTHLNHGHPQYSIFELDKKLFQLEVCFH